ncbi:MAG: hypothetical protein R3C11_15880 [Planctomycetaceae bacterium]
MYTYPVQLKNYQNDWFVSVGGHRNAVSLREKLQKQGIKISKLQELDGTSNYSFRIPRTTRMDRLCIQKLLKENSTVRMK